MKKAILFLSVILFGFLGKVLSQDIYTYVAASTAGAPSFVNANIATASNLTPVGTGFNTPCAMGYSGIDGFTAASYSSANPCVQVSLTAAAGYVINATGFTAYLRNSNTGPTKARLAYSSDGGVTWIDDGVDHVPFLGSCATSLAGTNLASWTTFSVVGPSLMFRIYPFAAPNTAGTFQVFELHIIGTVNCGTPPAITVTPSSGSFCSGGAGVLFTASGAGAGGTYTWATATGLSATTGAIVNAAPASTTIYTVTGTTTLGCSGTATASVTVNPLPAATITASGAVNFCAGDSVTLTANAGAGLTYQWYNGAAVIAGATNISYTANAAGNYSVAVTNSLGCTATSAVTAVTILAAPPATITATGSAVFCVGGSVVLNAPGGAGYAYQWYNGGAVIPGATTASYTVSATSLITVKVTAPTGCSSTSASQSVTAVPLPYIDTTGPSRFCAGNSIYLAVNVGGGVTTGITFQWNRNAVPVSGATAQTYLATAAGTYTCDVNISGSCLSTTAPVVVTLYPLPYPVINYDGTRLNTVGTFVSYQWFLNTVTIPGATNSTFTPTVNGSYRVRVYDANGCSAYSAYIQLARLGVGTVNYADVKIFPNPASNVIHIESPADVKAVITGIEGKVIMEQSNARDMNISSLASGVYLVVLYDNNGNRVALQKLVKE